MFFMKNTFKLLGFIALVAIIGFSCLGCDNGSSSSGSTYTTFRTEIATWATEFGGSAPAAPGNYAFGTKTRAELLAYCEANYSSGKDTGVKLSDIESLLQQYEDGGTDAGFKDDVVAKLNANGYCLVGVNAGPNFVILAAFKD